MERDRKLEIIKLWKWDYKKKLPETKYYLTKIWEKFL